MIIRVAAELAPEGDCGGVLSRKSVEQRRKRAGHAPYQPGKFGLGFRITDRLKMANLARRAIWLGRRLPLHLGSIRLKG